MINAVLISEKPESIVAIGIARGFSTSAIIEAVETTPEIKSVDLVDPCKFPELVSMLHGIPEVLKRTQISGYYIPSQRYEGCPEAWFIDGDHRDGAEIDYRNSINRKAKIIIIHDSNPASSAGPQNWGAVGIANRLKHDSKAIFEDCDIRQGEMTDRGLVIGFFYDPKPDTLQRLKEIAK
jgi:hypothetical protein